MNALLHDKVAFVTGGARGLGRAIVDEFSASGATGMSFDLDSPEQALPSGWRESRGDVSVEQDLKDGFAACIDHFGRVDVVVANAGLVPPWSDTENLNMDEWDHVFGVNVRGVAATIKHAVPWMKESGGSVIVMGSLNSQRGHANQCLYTASKHAVLGIVRSVARDLGRYDIRVNALGPGPIATAALVSRIGERATQGHPQPERVLEDYAAETPLGRMASAENVAATAVFLASGQSAGVNGQLIAVDAGLT